MRVDGVRDGRINLSGCKGSPITSVIPEWRYPVPPASIAPNQSSGIAIEFNRKCSDAYELARITYTPVRRWQ